MKSRSGVQTSSHNRQGERVSDSADFVEEGSDDGASVASFRSAASDMDEDDGDGSSPPTSAEHMRASSTANSAGRKAGTSTAGVDHDRLDLLSEVNGMYRILDLVSEQGSGGLGKCQILVPIPYSKSYIRRSGQDRYLPRLPGQIHERHQPGSIFVHDQGELRGPRQCHSQTSGCLRLAARDRPFSPRLGRHRPDHVRIVLLSLLAMLFLTLTFVAQHYSATVGTMVPPMVVVPSALACIWSADRP